MSISVAVAVVVMAMFVKTVVAVMRKKIYLSRKSCFCEIWEGDGDA